MGCSGCTRLGSVTSPSVAPSPAMVWTADKFRSGGVRGFNSPADVTDQSMTALKATGANIVRVFVNLTRSGSTYTADVSTLNAVVAAGAAKNFKVVITFDVLPNQFAQEYWSNTSLQNSILAQWVILAARFRGNQTIVGYDLINEPIAPNQGVWTTFATRIATAIRAVDPEHVIIHEPSPGGLPSAFADAVKLPFSNVVYSVHAYLPYEISHQGINGAGNTTRYDYPLPSSSALGTVDRAWLSSQLNDVRTFVAANDVPIYVGEFSCVRWAPNAAADTFIGDSISIYEAEGWAWTYHSWREYQGWDAEVPASYFQSRTYTNAYPTGWESENTALFRVSTTPALTVLKAAFARNLTP